MPTRRQVLLASLAIVISAFSLQSVAQVTTSTLQVGTGPGWAEVNTVTNTIYVANEMCNDTYPCTVPGTVTAIDGATNNIKGKANVGIQPGPMAVNSVTNKIYVTNLCGNDSTCQSPGTVTVIDGNTLATQTVHVSYVPASIAVNTLTNTIYVANLCLGPGYPLACPVCDTGMTGTLTVINGSTLATQNVSLDCAPNGVAVNQTTNVIYASSTHSPGVGYNGTVTAIDGTTFAKQTVATQVATQGVAVNPTTNQIYTANQCGTDPLCQNGGSLTVIDGVTLTAQNVAAGFSPISVAVNPSTNNVYAANLCRDLTCTSGPAVTVVNGTTLSTQTLPVCGAGYYAANVEVNAVTNKMYFPCDGNGGTVAAIDGATNAITPIAVGDQPTTAAVNPATNNIYVPNYADNTLSVIGGATTLQLTAVMPCRLVDTRQSGGPIPGGTYRSFNLPQLASANHCASLNSAAASSLNVTLVPQSGMPVSYLTIWPTSQIQPVVSTMNSFDGRTKANAAIVRAGVDGAVNIYITNTADVVLDLDGYFAPASAHTLQFYALTPCRVADTRSTQFPQGLGVPHLSAATPRDFPVLESSCIPQNVNAAAYSFNVTAIPYPNLGDPLYYLEVWPTGGEPQSPVSTLNNSTGTYVANAAIVQAGTGGEITAYASNNTDVAIDINGYFAAPGTGGLSLYPTVPCRVFDTRKIGNGQPFTGTLSPPVDVVDSPCSVAATAQAYVFNATVVPPGYLGYLTLWPDSEGQPVVSTLNAADGLVTSNMAVVPNVNGSVDAYAAGLTQLVLDISGYFAQ